MANPGRLAQAGSGNPFKYHGKELQEDAFDFWEDANKNNIHQSMPFSWYERLSMYKKILCPTCP
jgi:hypothetical protein